MSEPFLGEIRAFAFAFAPRGWAICAGQLLPIAQNTALFSILGVTYGGDGRSTFALPDLRGNVPIGQGSGPGLSPRPLGEQGGASSVTLTGSQLPMHSHAALANAAAGNSGEAPAHDWAADAGGSSVYAAGADAQMAADTLGTSGGGQAHDNMQPSLAVNYCIALSGIYPPRS